MDMALLSLHNIIVLELLEVIESSLLYLLTFLIVRSTFTVSHANPCTSTIDYTEQCVSRVYDGIMSHLVY